MGKVIKLLAYTNPIAIGLGIGVVAGCLLWRIGEGIWSLGKDVKEIEAFYAGED